MCLSGDGKTLPLVQKAMMKMETPRVMCEFFRNGDSDWMQLGQDIDGEEEYDISGWAVSLSTGGKTVVIGSPYINDDEGWNFGQVRVYYFDEFSSSWVQQGLDLVGDLDGDEGGSSHDRKGLLAPCIENDGPRSIRSKAVAGLVECGDFEGSDVGVLIELSLSPFSILFFKLRH